MHKKALCLMAHGGHTAQMRILTDQLKEDLNLCYVINKRHLNNPNLLGLKGEIYPLLGARTITSGLISDILGTLAMFFQALFILLKSNPDAIISTGTSPAIPFSYLGKVTRKKIIFIETWCRVSSRSGSGRLVYPIADLFFVQWKRMKALYARAIYAGRFT